MYKEFEIIEWLDHATYSESSWRSEDNIKELVPVKVITLGFVVSEDKTSVRIAATITDNSSFTGEFLIIKKAIVRRSKIKNPFKSFSND